MKLILCFIILCIYCISKSLCITSHYTNYYWRDYNGVVPEDAFSAGKDINGEEVYIGQVYHHGYGFKIAELRPGKAIIFGGAYWNEIYNATTGVKIFCTDESYKFQWVSVSDATYEDDLKNYKGFLSFAEYFADNSVSKVGRLMYEGSTKIGYTLLFSKNLMKLCFADGDRNRCSGYYEQLVFNDSEDSN